MSQDRAAPAGGGYLVVRSTVKDAADRAAFDLWYGTDHAPLAARTLGAIGHRRYWSRTDPNVHVAIYTFTDLQALERTMGSGGLASLMAEYDRRWSEPEPRATRTREIWVDADAARGTP